MNKYIVYGLLAAILVVALLGLRGTTVQLGAEGDTNLTNLVLSGPFTTTANIVQSAAGTTSIGGGLAIDYVYATTTAWDSGALAQAGALKEIATSSATFILRPDAGNNLPAVGDVCIVGNPNASTSRAETYGFNVTAVDTTNGNASGTLLYTSYGAALIDYGVASLQLACINY